MLQFMLSTSLSDALKFPLKLSDFSVMPLDPSKGPSDVVWGSDKETLLDLPAVALPGDRWHRPKSTQEFIPYGQTIVAVDPRYFRPTEVETLLGDPSKAKQNLGWEPKIKFVDLVKEMTHHDLEEAKKDELLKRAGFKVLSNNE